MENPLDTEGLLNDFLEVRECDYKGEHYSVRDNGAVMRHPKPGKKPRALDNVWTFGVKNVQSAYMYISTHRVHIIVANAFLGERDSKIYVVDHIDTNRCNNRVTNLRWFTRLENALNNPITVKRIEYLCGGDIQKFIDDPSCLRTAGNPSAKDLEWMRTVSREEAAAARSNLMKWASKPSTRHDSNESASQSPKKPKDVRWMFKRPPLFDDPPYVEHVHAVEPAVAVQVKWNIPSVFPLCPKEVTEDTLQQYYQALKPGLVFAKNRAYESIVSKAILPDNKPFMLVATYPKEGMKSALAKVYVKDGVIVHESCGTFFTDDGLEKEMTLQQGLPWTGPDSIDDYC